MKSHGFEVTVLYEDRNKAITSSEVRGLIATNDPTWKKWVPGSVADYLITHQILARIAGQNNS
jgi:hypothetical protein